MYEYVVCNHADEVFLQKQCRMLERHIPGLQVGEFLDCLDDTYIQYYQHPKGSIEVRSDADIDYVCIKSEFELPPYLPKGTPWDQAKNRFRDQEMVRIKETGATGRIIRVLHRANGTVRYDVEGHRKDIRTCDRELLYRAEELEKIN